MVYKFNRTLLKSGDKILVHTRGLAPVSFSIRHLTGSFFDHIGQYEEEVDKKGYVIEAVGKGVVRTPIEKYLPKKYYLKVVRLRPEAFKDPQEYKDGLQTSRERIYAKIGTKYDYWAIAWLGCKYIFKGWFKKIPINLFQSREKVFCSELICENDYRISSLYPYLYQGKTRQFCDTTTPKDIGKAKTVEFITGVNKV